MALTTKAPEGASEKPDAERAPPPAPAAAPGAGSERRAPHAGRIALWHLVIFAVLFVAVDLLVMVGLEPLALADSRARAGTAITRTALYHHTPAPLDVVIMGSSRAQVSLSPQILADRVRAAGGRPPNILNLGLSGGAPMAHYWMLKNVIQPDKQPRVILYGAAEYEYFFMPAFREPSTTYAIELARWDDYDQVFSYSDLFSDFKVKFVLSQFWPLLRYSQAIHDTVGDFFSSASATLVGGTVEATRGWVPVNHVMDWKDIGIMRASYQPFLDPTQTKVEGPQADSFVQLLKMAQRRGIHVIVLNLPITLWHESFVSTPETRQVYAAYMRDTTAKYGADYVDYNNRAEFPNNDFADTHHLNIDGAQKLSRLVGDQVLAPALRDAGSK